MIAKNFSVRDRLAVALVALAIAAPAWTGRTAPPVPATTVPTSTSFAFRLEVGSLFRLSIDLPPALRLEARHGR